MVFLVDVSELKNFIKMITLRTLATAVQGILTLAGGERYCGKKLPITFHYLTVIVNTSFTCKDLRGIPQQYLLLPWTQLNNSIIGEFLSIKSSTSMVDDSIIYFNTYYVVSTVCLVRDIT